jgi:microcystin-dependent protein
VTATYSTANPDINMAAAALTGAPGLNAAGNGQPLSLMQPFLCLTFIIALEGIFPSRN